MTFPRLTPSIEYIRAKTTWTPRWLVHHESAVSFCYAIAHATHQLPATWIVNNIWIWTLWKREQASRCSGNRIVKQSNDPYSVTRWTCTWWMPCSSRHLGILTALRQKKSCSYWISWKITIQRRMERAYKKREDLCATATGMQYNLIWHFYLIMQQSYVNIKYVVL